MISWLNYKGRSSDLFGIYIQKKNSFDSAERDLSFQSVPGRNGDVIIDNGRYKNINLSYTIATISESQFVYAINEFKNWLLPASSYYKLYDSYDTEHYRLAALSGGLSIEQKLFTYGTTTIKFNCKPFRYSFFGNRISTLTQSGTVIKNRECYSSLPYMRIFGSGNITLFINNNAFYFYDVNEFVEIDSDMMNCFKGTSNLNNKMQSENFPTLEPGKNIISWTGDVSKIELKPRWRTL